MSDKLRVVTHEGELKIGDYTLKTFVFEDGTAMFEKESFEGFWEYLANGGTLSESDASTMAKFVKGVE